MKQELYYLQLTKAKIIGAPQLFLNKRFPDWKDDCKTHMIPPAFTAKNYGSHQIGIKGAAAIVDKGDVGEAIIYNLLEQLGRLKKIGMFVVNGFKLNDLTKWNQRLRTKDFIVSKNYNGEFDFIIFHHTLGIISLEVKNYSDIEKAVPKALSQLEISKHVIKKLATYDTADNDDIDLPHRKVFAMPSTKKSEFDPVHMEDDIILLFEEDCQSTDALQKWWQETLETPTGLPMTPEMQAAYETALSFTLMIRHLYPVTEPEYVIDVFHESLNGYTCHKHAAYQQILENEFPNFWDWCGRVLSKKDGNCDFGDGDAKELKDTFMKGHRIKSLKDLINVKIGVKCIDEVLKNNKYISGNELSKIDEVLVDLFTENYFLFHENILKFINTMRKMQTCVVERGPINDPALLERYPFLKLESYQDFNRLDRFLAKHSFVHGTRQSIADLQLFETLTCQMTVKRYRLPMVLTPEQLAVFEGPLKQLIIGPPGSGKTDLLSHKAKDLQLDMMKNKIERTKILYIVANGSPKYHDTESLFCYRTRDFFKNSSIVDVIVLTLEEENSDYMQSSISKLKDMMKSENYSHVFVDEYWIGSKPAEHKIILDLVDKIKGYVWISSVFDFSVQPKHTERISGRTGPLLEKLRENGGTVSRLTTVLRPGNSIVQLERGYSEVYSQRSYPYGTKQILGHSLEGLPVTWAVEKDVDGMYTTCADIVDHTIRDTFSVDGFRRDKFALHAHEILVVDFAIRMDTSTKQSLEELLSARSVPFLAFGEDTQRFKVYDSGKVTLLQSLTRDASSYLDGVEWPMVIVILPSGLLLNTSKLSKGAQKLRNYDPYISLFRAMVKLVVISDKWESDKDFLFDVAQKAK